MPDHPSENPVEPSPSLLLPRRGGVWLPAILLTASVLGLLLFDNRHYLFGSKLYEFSDWAANSLLVREAMQGFLLHGHYSRWAFYHPGPAFLDTLAAGEVLFYDKLHLVPTPYNGQIIALCIAMTLFFSLALTIFARQLGNQRGGFLFFLPMALLIAIWHYGTAGGGHFFLNSWPAYPPVLVFLCLLVASAAVAAGDGGQLPVLVLAGGWLVHNYVAQPLFVVPLALLAYAGLLVACRRSPLKAPAVPRQASEVVRAPWRAFPRAHWIALGLLVCFLLPLVVDASHGNDSNLSKILQHLRTHHDPNKKFIRSVCYFLVFGSEEGYQPGRADFGRYSAAGMWAFVERHWRVYSLWGSALLAAPALFLGAHLRLKKQGQTMPVAGRSAFIPWFYTVLIAAVGLTLVWGTKQDGPMFYFNAYFNYSIYYAMALGFAAAAATALMAWTPPTKTRWRAAIATLLWISVAGSGVFQAAHYRLGGMFDTPENQRMATTVERAAAALPKDAVCFLGCSPWENWPFTVAVALEVERLGHKLRVDDGWEIMFGNGRTIQHETLDAATPLVHWMVVPASKDPARLNNWLLMAGSALDVVPLPSLNPAGQSITFTRDGNFLDFAYFGWSGTDGPWTWSDQRNGLLAFRPLPLPPGAVGVDMVISAWAAAPVGKTDLPRMVVQFDGETADTTHLPLYRPDVPPVHVLISASNWQQAVARSQGRLRFVFPDAKSPASLGLSTDTRLLGAGFHSIEFRPLFTETNPVRTGSEIPEIAGH